MAEFASNNSKHATTGASLFYPHTGRNPRLDTDLGKEPDGKHEVPEATTGAAVLLRLRDEIKERRLEAVKTPAKYYNKKATPQQLRVGEKIWLSGKNIRTVRSCKKLDYKFYGLYRILLAVGQRGGVGGQRDPRQQTSWREHPLPYQVGKLF